MSIDFKKRLQGLRDQKIPNAGAVSEAERNSDINKSGGLNDLLKARQRLQAETEAKSKGVKQAIQIANSPALTKLQLPSIIETEKKVESDIALSLVPPMQPIQSSLDLFISQLLTEFPYDETQLLAIRGVVKNRYACIVGRAGTGKTTVSTAAIRASLQYIPTIDLNLSKVESQREKQPILEAAMCIVSFTGRAVQQLRKTLPEKFQYACSTIHSLLGYAPVYEDEYDEHGEWTRSKMVFRPTFNASNRLQYKLCVIDETGMVPIYLYNEMIDALPADCKIIMMGDINQLTPVQGRSVLGFAMAEWPTFTLEKLHRNAGIIAKNAHRILEGKAPLKDKKKFVLLYCEEGSRGMLKFTKGVVQQLHRQGKFDPFTDALIVPQNKGFIGQTQFNEDLVYFFNPLKAAKPNEKQAPNKRIIISAGYENPVFAVGDKVMLLKNDTQRALTNGMTGIITHIIPNPKFKGQTVADDISRSMHKHEGFNMDVLEKEALANSSGEEKANEEKEENPASRQASHTVKVSFAADCADSQFGEIEFSTTGEIASLAHAYAITCHKSQGGEYPTVVICLHSANAIMLNREWLYTAVTRAKERVILICNLAGLSMALHRQVIQGETIEEKVANFIALSTEEGTILPNLHEPQLEEYGNDKED